MDPNRTLADLRAWASGDHPMDDIHREAAENFLALDRWLSKGGFLPTPWRHQPTNTTKELELMRQDLRAAQSKLASAIQDLSTFPQTAPSEPQAPAQAPQQTEPTACCGRCGLALSEAETRSHLCTDIKAPRWPR